MLFTAKLQEINATLNSYTQQIEDLQSRLEQLREEKKALENHAQQLQSVEAAAESALQQLNTAVIMAKAVDSEQVVILQDAVNAIFNAANAQLVEQINAVTEEVTLEELDNIVPFPESELTDGLSDATLSALFSFAELKKIAKALSVTPNGKKKVDYAKAIAKEKITLFAAKDILGK